MSKKNEKEIKTLIIQQPVEKQTKEDILSRLFQETEAPIQNQTSNFQLDKLNEIAKALKQTYSIDLEHLYFAGERNTYKIRYLQQYYIQLYRLHGITVTDGNIKRLMKNKPKIFAKRTIEIVYNRFPKGTVVLLRLKNIKVNGIYLFKHFQAFNEIGLIELEKYIDDAIRLMTESAYWNQFLRKLSRLNNRPYQLEFFDTE